MARIKKSSRQAALLAAFVGVMSTTGGLIGAVGGVMLALLTRILLGLDANTIYLMAVSTLLGVVSAAFLSVVMVARQTPAPVSFAGPGPTQSNVAAPVTVESN